MFPHISFKIVFHANTTPPPPENRSRPPGGAPHTLGTSELKYAVEKVVTIDLYKTDFIKTKAI
jgi:hypothetical protein